MSTIVSTTVAPFFMDNQDTVLVTQTGAVLGNGAALYNVQGLTTAFNVTLTINGQVASLLDNAIWLRWPNATNAQHNLVIGSTGRVDGHTNLAAVWIEGGSDAVQNFGHITGGVALYCNNWSNGKVENHGVMAGLRYDAVRFENTASTRLLNTGTITGEGGILLTNATLKIVNTGELLSSGAATAALHAANGTAGIVLRNHGLVAGIENAVTGSANAELVVNTGEISGDVELGAGNDIYRGKSGTMSGVLDGGTGNDTLTGGLSDDEIIGGVGNDRLAGNGGDNALAGGANRDTFVFSRGGGSDTISDFVDNFENLNLSSFHLANFAAAAALARNAPGGLFIDFSSVGGGSVFVEGMTMAQFDASDVIL